MDTDREIRITNYNDLDKYLKSDYEYIGIGSEGCIYKLPDENSIVSIITKIFNNDKYPRIVTPFIPEDKWSKIEKIINLIVKNIDSKIDLVINDFGLLEYLYEKELTGFFNIYLGRLLSFSFAEIPYYDYIIDNELKNERDDRKKENILKFAQILNQNGFHNHEKMNYLKKYNITGIEASYINEKYNNSLAEIKDFKLKINVIKDTIIVAVSRACQYAKYLNTRPPDCKNKCDNLLRLELQEISSLWGKEFFKKNESYHFFPNIFYKNNITYTINKNIFKYQNYYNCVIEEDFNDNEALNFLNKEEYK